MVTYEAQLAQLQKERDSVEKDFKEWEETTQPGEP
jgi:hypothetical protein